MLWSKVLFLVFEGVCLAQEASLPTTAPGIPQKLGILGAFWAVSGRLGASCGVLGPHFPCPVPLKIKPPFRSKRRFDFGLSWGVLGASWAGLGRFLGAFWAVSGRLGAGG
jgi:hypothetical protein